MQINSRSLFSFILFVSTSVLLAVCYLDFSGSTVPCKLCIYERWPYFAAIPVALLGIWKEKITRLCLYLLAIIFLTNIGLSAFHIAVEQKWYEYSSPCTTTDLRSDSIEEFKKKLEQKDLVSCDQSDYKVLGISLTMWNFIISLTIYAYILLFLKRRGHNKPRKRLFWY